MSRRRLPTLPDLRPLDAISGIRMKFALVVALAVLVAALVSVLGYALGIPVLLRPPIALVISLVFVRIVAHGLTAPLREMEVAATAMAAGDYGQRVRSTSRDEVGRLAIAFNTMAAQLEAVDRERRDLVANVSHELRTPLSALQAHLENLVDGVEPADPEVLRTMLAQTERLGRMVSQLLDLSRLESGKVPLHRAPVDAATLLRRAADESRLHRPEVDVRVDVDPPDLRLDVDGERLHQVVANLLDNAGRHSPSGEAVDLRARRDAVGAVVIEVLDRGPGIDAAEAERVFERFYRADQARAADGGGAGLGLAIARWIVELHGGSLRAEPRAPNGCRMVVRI